MREPYWLAEDCPNCGLKDSPDAWKGARMGSTAWGHDFMCCSDKCGMEYASSPKRWQREIDSLDQEMKGLRRHRRELVERLVESANAPTVVPGGTFP